MGTRSLTRVFDEQGKELCCVYKQHDGYPSGLGTDYVKKYSELQLCNGFGKEQMDGGWSNGMQCFAAQLVADLKYGIGGVYLMPPGTTNADEDYVYEFRSTNYKKKPNRLIMYVYTVIPDGDTTAYSKLWSGPIWQYNDAAIDAEERRLFAAQYEEEEEERRNNGQFGVGA